MAGIISLADAKLHLKVDTDLEDGLIQSLIDTAARYIEREYAVLSAPREISVKSYRYRREIRIPFAPIDEASITIAFRDADGNAQDFTAFQIATEDDWTWLRPNPGACWPKVWEWGEALVITAEAGGWVDVPDDLVHATRLLVTHFYDHRDGAVVPPMIDMLLDHYRYRRV